VKRLLRLAFIGGLALTVGYFNTYIINAVNGAQGALVQSFAPRMVAYPSSRSGT